MMKWLKSQTTSVDTWIEAPRIERRDEDEVKGLAERLKPLSTNDSRFLTIVPTIYDDIIVRLGLVLGLGRDELLNSLHDQTFVKKTFGQYRSMVDFVSGGRMETQLAIKERRRSPSLDAQSRRLDRIGALLDQLEKWVKEYESP
jgi:hypothetical protein